MTPGWLLTSVLSLAILLSLTTGRARAQTPRARVELTSCPSELGVAVETALDVELSMADPEARLGLAEGTLRCALVCDASGTTAVVVRGDVRIEQRIPGEGAGLPRRLAIALAELLDASSAATPEPVAEPEPAGSPPARDSAPAPEAPQQLQVRARIAGGTWLGGAPFVALGAIELGLELAPTSNIALVIGAAGALGTFDVEAGRLDVRLVSGSASLRFGGEVGLLWLGAGPAVRGGAVLWTGAPDDPARAVGRDTIGGWLGVGAVGAGFVRVGELPVRVGLEAEGGGIAYSAGALALGAVAARIDGGWLELRLAIDLTFE